MTTTERQDVDELVVDYVVERRGHVDVFEYTISRGEDVLVRRIIEDGVARDVDSPATEHADA